MTIKKFIAGSVLVLFLMAPVSASAAMTSEQVQLLNTLIQLVTQLQTQLNALIAANGGTMPADPGSSSVTINASSLSQTAGSFKISGTASNTDNVTVFLEISGQNFTDYQTVNNQAGKDGFYRVASKVSHGKWSAPFTYSAPASFTVLVFDSSSRALLKTGLLTVSAVAGKGGGVTCAYISNSNGIARGINISSSASANSCKSACVIDRNEVYGLSDAGACVYTSASGFQTVMSIPSENAGPVSCVLSTDKPSYTYGKTITLTWSSTNATYASWHADTSGKETLSLSGDKLSASGSQTVKAGVIGAPTVTLDIFGPSGSSSCSVTPYVYY